MSPKVTIEFEYPRSYDRDYVVSVITEGMCDQDQKLADRTNYKIVEGEK